MVSLPTVANRVLRGLMYGSFLAAGVLACFIPSTLIESELGWARWMWAAFLIIGGLTSLSSVLTGVWLGEFAGLPLLFTATGAYAGSVISSAGVTSLNQLVAGFVLLAVTWGLIDRWRDVWIVSRQTPTMRKRARQWTQGSY